MFGKAKEDKRMHDFLGKEKKRRQAAEDFLRFAAQVITHVAKDIWGTSQNEIAVGEIFFLLNESAFYANKEKKEEKIAVFSQNGTSFWESVCEVKEFLGRLVEDVREREAGRNQLVNEMKELAGEIAADPSFCFKKTASL